MNRMDERQDKVIQEFAHFQTWEDRYRHIIDRGKKMGDLPESMKIEDVKVRGCQSQVWLHAQKNPKGEIEFQADSDAMIVKGLVSLVLDVYSHSTPDEILSTAPVFLRKIGLDTHLSPSRTNGLYSVVKQIMFYAMALKAQGSQ